jgi:predicted Zn-dependent protease
MDQEEMERMSESLTDNEIDMIRKLRDRGFAVSVFTPEERGNASVEDIEDAMVEAGWYNIRFMEEQE